MARTVRMKVYKFNELSETAKKKAIEVYFDINYYSDYWEYIYEDAANIGIKITSFDIDRNRNATGEFTLSANEVAQNILNTHGESCDTYKTAKKFMKEWEPIFADYMQTEEGEDKLMEMENDFLKSLLKNYSIMLQVEVDYIRSEKAIIETIEANEYEFTKDGSKF